MDKYMPDIYQKNIYTIDYKKLYNRGIRCILFDIDNTLVSRNSEEIDNKVKELFEKIKKMKIEPIIYSNSSSNRVDYFKDELKCRGYSHVHSHIKKKIDAILYDYKESEIAIVGDEMINDVSYGNKLGITTILVNPISTKDSFLSFSRRGKEKRVMTKLRNNNLFVKGRYYE